MPVTLSSRTQHLTQSSLFKPTYGIDLSLKERTKLVYDRARAIARTYKLTPHDVTALTEKFWAVTADNIFAIDSSAIILLTIQYNLAAGTLAPFAEHRPELRPLLDQMLNFDISAQFLLTELGHGLDARNLETTATLLPSGEYDLHTPRLEASKYMPPTGVVEGMDRVAIVMARLIVDGDDRGIRPFVVLLSTNGRMCEGVTSRLLPGRPGTEALDHAVTRFNHVRLPSSALLGDHKKPTDFRANFMSCIHRVSIGSLAVSLVVIPSLSVSAYIAAKYSLQRTVAVGPDSASGPPTRAPIWNFRTQQIPILRAFAQVEVMKAFANEAITSYTNTKTSLDPRTRAGIACCVKAFLAQQGEGSLSALSERCGAQGLFNYNQIASTQLAIRGAIVAEGDVLALCIRLASELLIGRYELPAPRHPRCLLALHEKAFFERCRALLASIGDHRSELFNQRILPLCRPLIEAISHRMAYEAALDSGTVHKPLLDLYEISAIRLYGAWFAEQRELEMGVSRQQELEEAAYIEASDAKLYAQAPILHKDSFDTFIDGLRTSGDALRQSVTDIGIESPFMHISARL
ncbi:acyl-CoA dehydrogenase NM domain-like protein [Schizopora paradoxa]|uniref:Acyl-CoA dehydrogenase NM domain-like protein n=1 Tax=Schizopora paradoxa TaxID=27342 RepID=A0A0H2RTZ2_9AGAM|nr:acyl-CoA dehydrogenase NM domain-like protein [Schizopora paradoxa]